MVDSDYKHCPENAIERKQEVKKEPTPNIPKSEWG
jgi:hypothetical protein